MIVNMGLEILLILVTVMDGHHSRKAASANTPTLWTVSESASASHVEKGNMVIFHDPFCGSQTGAAKASR